MAEHLSWQHFQGCRPTSTNYNAFFRVIPPLEKVLNQTILILTQFLIYLPFLLGLRCSLSSMSRWASSSTCPVLCKKLKTNKKLNSTAQTRFGQASSETLMLSLFLISNSSQLARPPKEWDSRHCALFLPNPQPPWAVLSILVLLQCTQTCWSWTQLFCWPVAIPHWRVKETWPDFQKSTFPTFYHPYNLCRWKPSHWIQRMSKALSDKIYWSYLFTSAS